METRFEGLQQKASYRSKRLQDFNKLFNFYREADEVESWIIERESVATSDDYGRDLEHVETLLKKFEDFMRDLVTSGERIAVLTAQTQALLDEGNSEEEVRQALPSGTSMLPRTLTLQIQSHLLDNLILHVCSALTN